MPQLAELDVRSTTHDEVRPKARRGRPAKAPRAMTASERQRASRRRRHEAAVSCTDDLQAATDEALLRGLAMRLKQARSEGEAAEAARWWAGRIVAELCRRHSLDDNSNRT